MKYLILSILLSASVQANPIKHRCRAYCIQVNYDDGRINLVKTFKDESKAGKNNIFFRMQDECSGYSGNFYLVNNFDISTRNAISGSSSNSSETSVHVGGGIELRKGFLGIGRKESAHVEGGVSQNQSGSQSNSKDVSLQFKLYFATPESSCVEYEYDPNEPIRYLDGQEVFG